MKKIAMLTVLSVLLFCSCCNAQMKYGYAVLHLRCGNNDAQRNTVYYSPVIELDRLNFEKYTKGVDPSFPLYSVRYYNYAIARWFEIYLLEHRKIAFNDPEKYERNVAFNVFDDKGNCNADKTDPDCFFTDKQKIIKHRNNGISESRSAVHENDFCGVIAL